MRRLEGRVALVTGAGRGIGRACALLLAREGARVVVSDIDEAPAMEVVREIEKAGGKATVCVGNVTADDFPMRLVSTALDVFGDVHIIVNNAGYPWDGVIQKLRDEQFDAMMDVHVKAPWRILREVSEHFRVSAKAEALAGNVVVRKVVNISSISGTRGNAGQSNYAAAKAAVVGLTRSLAKEWGRYNVTVNSVAFGLIDTRLTTATDDKQATKIGDKTVPMGVPVQNIEMAVASIPMGRAGTPEEAGGAVLLFCLPESNFVSGQLLEVTGGQ